MKRIFTFSLLFLIGISGLAAALPGWWEGAGTEIIDAEADEDNYAPANLGQLKYVAKQAKAYFDTVLPGGSGSAITTMVEGFEPRSGQGYAQQQIDSFIRDNYAPVNLGQLKAVARLFYVRLLEVGYDTKANLIARGYPSNWAYNFPWDPQTPVEDNYALANLGQLKLVFSFDLLDDRDAVPNGLPDWWERLYFGQTDVDPSADADGDGLNNLQEFQNGSDPTDYFNGVVPTLSIVPGSNGQTGLPGAFLENPLAVEVKDGSGNPFINAPIRFTVSSVPPGEFSFFNDGTGALDASIIVRTGSNGIATVHYLQPDVEDVLSIIEAKAGNTAASVAFEATTLIVSPLVGHWKLNEGSGEVAVDSSPRVNDGLLVNGPQRAARYPGEGSLSFSGPISGGGIDDYVAIATPANGTLDFDESDFSASGWVKYGLGAPAARIISKGQKGWTPGYYMGIDADGRIETGLGTTEIGDSSEAVLIKTVGAYNDGEWHHVAIVYDRENSTARIYVDGTSQPLVQVAGTGGEVDGEDDTVLDYVTLDHLSGTRPDIPLTLSSNNGSEDFFLGGVDDVRIYRKALSEGEVRELHTCEKPLLALAGQLTLDEDTVGSIFLESEGGGDEAASYEIITSPVNGELVLHGDTVDYFPNAHYYGSDSFRFRVTKGIRTSEADVVIVVTPVNQPPLVSVGGSRSITLPATLALTAAVTDIDNSSEEITLTWSKDFGPADVVFSHPNSLDTTVDFAVPGEYVLRLIANDGLAVRSDSLTVVVNEINSLNHPVIILELPENNSSYNLNERISFKADATAGSGNSISKVEFYEGSRKIGESVTPIPSSNRYELDWTPVRLGIYAVSAIVTDSVGTKGVSSTIQVRVVEGGWFSDPGMISGNEGYTGSGGNGGIPTGATTGPGGAYGGQGGNGGGASAGGGGNGLGSPKNTDPYSIDTDGDGLSDGEELELGLNPVNKDSDADGVPDGEDGWAKVSGFAPARLPITDYVIVDTGISSSTAIPAVKLNNKSEVASTGFSNSYFWRGGVIQNLSGYVKAMSNAGVILTSLPSAGVGQDILWSSAGNISITGPFDQLPTPPAGDPEDEPSYLTMQRLFVSDISDNGSYIGTAGLVTMESPWSYSQFYYDSPVVSGASASIPFSCIGGNLSAMDAVLIYDDLGLYPRSVVEAAIGSFVYSPTKINKNNVIIGSRGEILDAGGEIIVDYRFGFAKWGSSEFVQENVIARAINNTNHVLAADLSATDFFLIDSKSGTKNDQVTDGTPAYRRIDWRASYGDSPRPGNELNTRLQVVSGGKLWQNAKSYSLEDLVSQTDNGGLGWSSINAKAVNDSGVIAATAVKQQQTHVVLLVPIEMKVVNRDNPIKRWVDAKCHSLSKPIYAGESCGDMVSWKLVGMDSWTDVMFKWTAEGPNGETIVGPLGAGKNEWTIADSAGEEANDWLKWKPGKWKIKVQIGSNHAEFEQEVGVRTEEYFVVGTIPVEAEITTGVSADTINDWACPSILYSIGATIGGGVNNPQSSVYVPMDEAHRVYVNHRLLNSTRNFDPAPSIKPEIPIKDACGLSPYKHYRWFSGCQFRFRVDDNTLAATPQFVGDNKADLVGFTPLPCSQSHAAGFIGQKHADSGKVTGQTGDAEFTYLSKNRAGNGGQVGFKNLNGRELPWVFFHFRFEAKDDGLIDTKFGDGASSDPNGPDAKDYSTVPTMIVYRRHYDLQDNKWKVEQVEKFDEDRRTFFSIGNPVSGAPYVIP